MLKKIFMFYFDELDYRYKRQKTKYHNPFVFMFHLFFWHLKFLAKTSLVFFQIIKNSFFSRGIKKDAVRIGIILDGGIGDVIMGTSYVKELYRYIGRNDTTFEIFTTQNINSIKTLFKSCFYIENIYEAKKSKERVWFNDAFIQLSRIPYIVNWNQIKIEKLSPNLAKLLSDIQDFNVRERKFFLNGTTCDALTVIYSKMNGFHRYNQMDYKHVLGMDESTRSYISIDPKGYDVFEKFGLTPKQFITLQRGTDASYKHGFNTRLWPVAYYEELVNKLKAQFPQYKIIQIGTRSQVVESVKNVDIDLCGKTNFEEAKVLMKYALLHIDGECGMVHLRHYLKGGPSAVFFGQTRVDFLGYSENFNIKAEGVCDLWCEWVTEDWMQRCLRGFDMPPCMAKLTPELVMSKITPFLQNECKYNYTLLENYSLNTSKNDRMVVVGELTDTELKAQLDSGCKLIYLSQTKEQYFKGVSNTNIETDISSLDVLSEKDDSSDVVIINLSSETQLTSLYAVLELLRIVKDNGVLVINNITQVPNCNALGIKLHQGTCVIHKARV